ncbi:MAG: hypothetical protein HYT97_01370 [Elusimicrobia bacterium]|nr:hypothetical protein [Elusimicrobiota bacterium]
MNSKPAKKLVIGVLGIAIAMSLQGIAFCGQSALVDIVMTIQNLSIQRLSENSIAVMAAPGVAQVTDRTIFKNDGNGAVNYAIKVANTVGTWSLVSTVPQANQYRLYALWHQWDQKPAVNEFQANDILTVSDQTSSDTLFFNDTESHAIDSVKGSNVAPNEERNLYIRFDAPQGGSGSATSQISVNAVALQ